MNRDKLKRIVESIEAAEKSIKTYSDHKRDIYSTNKDEFDPKVLRKIIARRRMDPESRTKGDDLQAQYENALGMLGELAQEAASGERTYQEAADAAGVSRRTMARQVARARGVPKSTDDGTPPVTTPPHDSETGEIHRGAMQSKDCAEVMWTEPSMSGSVVASGDAVRDASAMPLDVAAAPHREGREHAGSAATAPPACSLPAAGVPAAPVISDGDGLKSCGGGESRPAGTTVSLDCGGGAAQEEMPASEEASPASAGIALDAQRCDSAPEKSGLGSATCRNGDTAGVAPGPQDDLEFPAHLKRSQPDSAKRLNVTETV